MEGFEFLLKFKVKKRLVKPIFSGQLVHDSLLKGKIEGKYQDSININGLSNLMVRIKKLA